MPKQRLLTIDGIAVDLSLLGAPGLEVRRGGSRGSRVELWWVASKDARKKGYKPRSVRLHGSLIVEAERDANVFRCRDLTEEMRRWLSNGGFDTRPTYDGTVRSLIRCYQIDPESPYKNVVQNTARTYDWWCGEIEKRYGDRIVHRLNAMDLRRWFNEIAQPQREGAPPRLSLARKCIRSMMSILLNYGVEKDVPGAFDLVQKLDRMTLSVSPEMKLAWNTLRRPQIPMTFEHADKLVTAGLAKGTIRHRSMALGIAAQFELTLAQIDVIGWWERLARGKAAPVATIARPGRVWRGGLRYEDFTDGMVLDMSRNKTGRQGIFDITEYPLLMRALAAVPEAEQRGPVTIDESRTPFQKRYYQALYAELAEACNLPKGVWNMNARHGGATEARASGVSIEDTAEHLQHANIATTQRHYAKPTVDTSRRVARARVANRNKDTA